MRGGFGGGAGSSGIERVGGEKDAGRESEDAPGGEKGARRWRAHPARGPGAHPSARRPMPMSDIAGEPAVPCVRPRARPRGRDPNVGLARVRPARARDAPAEALCCLCHHPRSSAAGTTSALDLREASWSDSAGESDQRAHSSSSHRFFHGSPRPISESPIAPTTDRARDFPFPPIETARPSDELYWYDSAPTAGRFGRSNVSLPLLSSPPRRTRLSPRGLFSSAASPGDRSVAAPPRTRPRARVPRGLRGRARGPSRRAARSRGPPPFAPCSMLPPSAATDADPSATGPSPSAMGPGSPGLNISRVSLTDGDPPTARREILELRKETNFASKHARRGRAAPGGQGGAAQGAEFARGEASETNSATRGGASPPSATRCRPPSPATARTSAASSAR